MNEIPFYRHYLKKNFEKRCRSNSAYSLRAFSRALGVSPGFMSRILSGKRRLSLNAALTISNKLNLPEVDRTLFIKSVMQDKLPRNDFEAVTESDAQVKEAIDAYDEELFAASADLINIGIMELTCVEGIVVTADVVSRCFGISTDDADRALKGLLRLGLLQREENGKIAKVKMQLRTVNREHTTQIHKSYQEQILKAAVVSLQSDPIAVRDMTSMAMAIDPDRLPQAKKMIETFTEHLCHYLEGGRRQTVYQLGVALYPLQKA